MILLLFFNFSLYSDVRHDIDTAYRSLINSLTSINTNYNVEQAAKVLIDIDTAKQLYENVETGAFSNRQKTVLTNKNNALYEAISYAESIVKNNTAGTTNINTIKENNNKNSLAKIGADKKKLQSILDFDIINPEKFNEKLRIIRSWCGHLNINAEEYKMCELDFLVSELKHAPKDINYQAFINACCSSAEIDLVKKQHQAFRLLAGLSTASHFVLGDYNLVSGSLSALTNQYSQKLLNEPYNLFKQQLTNIDSMQNIPPQILQNMISNNAGFTETLALFNNNITVPYNPNFHQMPGSSNNNNNSRRPRTPLDSIELVAGNTASFKTFNNTAELLKTRRGVNGPDDTGLGDGTADTNIVDLTPEAFLRNEVAEINLKLEELAKSNAQNNQKYTEVAIACLLASPLKKISCANEQVDLYAQIQVDNVTRQNYYYQIQELAFLYAASHYTYNFIDVFIEALSFKSLYASRTKEANKALKLLDLEKPFDYKTAELKPDWEKILAKVIKDFENKARIAKKQADKHKKKLRNFLKIKEKELSVNELAKMANILESYSVAKDIEVFVVNNQKKLNNTVKFNKNFKKDKNLFEKANELNNSYTKLHNTTKETKAILADAFFTSNNLFNEAIFNMAYKDYASDLLKE